MGLEPTLYSFADCCLTIRRTATYLVEYPGIEPGVPLGGGFTVHCITIDASTPNLAPVQGVEPRLTVLETAVLP